MAPLEPLVSMKIYAVQNFAHDDKIEHRGDEGLQRSLKENLELLQFCEGEVVRNREGEGTGNWLPLQLNSLRAGPSL